MRLARVLSHKAVFWVSYRHWYIDISNLSDQFSFFLFADDILNQNLNPKQKFDKSNVASLVVATYQKRIDYDWRKLMNFLTNESIVNPFISYKGKNMLNTSAFLMIVPKQSVGSTT